MRTVYPQPVPLAMYFGICVLKGSDRLCIRSVDVKTRGVPFSGLTPMIETPVKTSVGSHHRRKGEMRLSVGHIIMVQRVVISYSPVCRMSCI